LLFTKDCDIMIKMRNYGIFQTEKIYDSRFLYDTETMPNCRCFSELFLLLSEKNLDFCVSYIEFGIKEWIIL